MTTNNNSENEPLKDSNERFEEIGQILFQGIKRLKLRKDQKNHLNQLDSKKLESVHGVNDNLNRTTT